LDGLTVCISLDAICGFGMECEICRGSYLK